MARTMTAGAVSPARPAGRFGTGVAVLVLLLVATAARWRTFGNPVVHIDEDFYLLVGGRMLHGALPFVDIFDRKPIGLFLIYALARLGGGNGVIEYQLLALIAVVATALLVFVMARRVSNGIGGLAAGILYLLYLTTSGGEGGQSPVFYNLPVAAAVAILFFARDDPQSASGDLRWKGAATMLLFGLALQIKYSVLFEGLFAGLALMGIGRARGRALPALMFDMLIWIGCALLPTIVAAAAYAAMGHLHEWMFANVDSILLRGAEPPPILLRRLRKMAAIVAPLLVAIFLRRWIGARPSDARTRDDLRLLDAWAASALLGVLLFGTWFDHYALPLFVPLTITAAPLAVTRIGRVFLIGTIFLAAVTGQHTMKHNIRKRGDGAMLAEAVKAVGGHRGCIFVYQELVSLYDATNSCFLTTRVFPSHLWQRREAGATGVDQLAEIRRVMALRPDRIVTMEPVNIDANPASIAIVYHVLRADYVPIWRHRLRKQDYVIYGLKPGLEPQGLAASRRSTRRSGMNQEAAKAA
jgi:hypothetical protein